MKTIFAVLMAVCLIVVAVDQAVAYRFPTRNVGAEVSAKNGGEAGHNEKGWTLLAVAEGEPVVAVAFRQQFHPNGSSFRGARMEATLKCGVVEGTKATLCIQREKSGELIATSSQVCGSQGVKTLTVAAKEPLADIVRRGEYFRVILLVEHGGAVVAEPPRMIATNQ